MIEGRGVVDIACTREDVIAFVTDLNRYKLADHKIGRVYFSSRDGDTVKMRHGGTLRGLPGPSVSLVLTVDAQGAHYQSDGTGVARLFLTFDGGFEISQQPSGVRVTHVERFHFHAPWRWWVEPWLRAWLQADIEAEMGRMKALLDAR